MSDKYRMVVLLKQVPDTSSKAGVNPDGTVDRARAKRMMNPFDKYALQKALEVKKENGGEVVVISMGPPPAIEVVVEALEYGADKGYLLSDRRLAASDTLSTAYALHMAVKHVDATDGKVDLVFTGLQTTDGDTAQTGPQIAERLDLPQVTYLEKLKMSDGKAIAQRVVEGGHQELEVPLPALMTVANSASRLEPKRFADVFAVKELQRDKAAYDKRVVVVNLDDLGANPDKAGLKGSPTVVGKTWKMGEIGGACVVFSGGNAKDEVAELLDHISENKPGILEEAS